MAAEFAAGASTVAFGTLGDPNLYSTFSYLAQTVRDLVPEVEVRTLPGITAMQDLASRAGLSLAEGTEPITLVPLNGGVSAVDAVDQALAGGGTVVGYKVGAAASPSPGLLRDRLHAAGRLDGAVIGARLGLAGEVIAPAARFLAGAQAGPDIPYLSTLIVPATRLPGTGSGLASAATQALPATEVPADTAVLKQDRPSQHANNNDGASLSSQQQRWSIVVAGSGEAAGPAEGACGAAGARGPRGLRRRRPGAPDLLTLRGRQRSPRPTW